MAEFNFKVFDATRDGIAKAGTGEDGVEIEIFAPFVHQGFKEKPRPSILPVDPEMTGSITCLMTTQTTDGTLLLTYEAASAATEAAEKVAAERGGDWKISPVICQHQIVHRKTSYSGGHEVMASKETFIVCIQQATPASTPPATPATSRS